MQVMPGNVVREPHMIRPFDSIHAMLRITYQVL